MPTPIKGTISGSISSTILGANQWSTPFEAWQRIQEGLHPGFNSLHGYVMPESPDNASIRFGNAFEGANIKLVQDVIGISITDQERVFQEESDRFNLSCHVDGMIYPSGDLEGIEVASGEYVCIPHCSAGIVYEGKTTSMQAYRNKWTADKIPQNYFLQCQHNMSLSGAEYTILSVLIFPETPDRFEEMGWEVVKCADESYLLTNDHLKKVAIDPKHWASVLSDMGYRKTYVIKRNDSLIEKMHEKYAEFWTRFILPQLPPEPMDLADIQRMYPEPVGTIVIQDEKLIDALAEYKEIGKEVGKSGNLEKRRAQLKTMFLAGAAKLGAVEDEESTAKWIFRDGQGKKLGSYYFDKRGFWSFR